MGRYGMPDRDERGRFMSDEDESYHGRSRPRYGDDDRGGRGRRHGGWYGDPEDHSAAGRERWAEGGRGGRHEGHEDHRSSRGRDYDEDQGDRRSGDRHGGWHGDSRGHSKASYRGWKKGAADLHDDDAYCRGERGGWCGDSRAHAGASRRGWQHRR